jgi:hypothetical protein
MSSLRTWVALLAIVSAVSAAGCDDDEGGGGGNADDFVGNWTFSSGMIDPGCTTVTVPPVDLTGATLAVTKVDGSRVRGVVSTGINCDVTFSVSGSTATAAAGSTCMVMASGLTVVANITSWTLTLSGTNLSSSLMGTINSLITCTPSGSGTLSKAQ